MICRLKDSKTQYQYRGKKYLSFAKIKFLAIILFLDGFDEVASNHAYIEKLIEQMPVRYGGGVFLTSRSSRIPIIDGGFGYIRLGPFTN